MTPELASLLGESRKGQQKTGRAEPHGAAHFIRDDLNPCLPIFLAACGGCSAPTQPAVLTPSRCLAGPMDSRFSSRHGLLVG